MTNETITLPVADVQMNAYVSHPDGLPKAGIIVFQEAFGVNHYIRSIADRFAAEGYLALAPELFHRTGQGIELEYTDYASVRPHMEALTTEGIEADAKAAYDWLMANGCDKVVSVGFCMGGKSSFIAASSLPLRAAVSFYGGGIAPALLDRVPRVSAPMLFFWGGKDTHIPRDVWGQIPAAFDAADKEQVTVEMGAADHGFFCNERASYHKDASLLAWPLVLNFLSQKLGTH